jgi:hypothetical protein
VVAGSNPVTPTCRQRLPRFFRGNRFFCGVFGVSFVFCSKKVVERPFFDDYLLNLHRENMHLRSENHAMCVHVADL